MKNLYLQNLIILGLEFNLAKIIGVTLFILYLFLFWQFTKSYYELEKKEKERKCFLSIFVKLITLNIIFKFIIFMS